MAHYKASVFLPCLKGLKSHIKIPGQPEMGQYFSSTLTRRNSTPVNNWSCPALKFPCFFPKSRSTQTKQVTRFVKLMTHFSNSQYSGCHTWQDWSYRTDCERILWGRGWILWDGWFYHGEEKHWHTQLDGKNTCELFIKMK